MSRAERPLLSPNLFLTGTLRRAADATTAAALQAQLADAKADSATSTQFHEGEYVRAQNLQSRPDLNGTVGKLVRFFPDKNRWAVQFDKLGVAESILIKPDNLKRGVRVCNVIDFANSEPQFATQKELTWAGRKIRLFGIQGYSSTAGSDEIYFALQSFRPGVVLMESFDLGDEVAIASGDTLSYREVFPSEGLAHALESVTSSEFRKTWSAEAVAVLSALRVESEIRFCGRLHSLSFDRMISRFTLLELKTALTQATELISQALAAICENRAAKGGDPVRLVDLPQNFICPLFPELGTEREQLMGHCCRCAADQGHDVAIVVGVEHLPGIVQHFDDVADANLSGKSYQDIVDDHVSLLSEVESHWQPGDDAWKEEIEKRSLVAAFLRSTLTFPPDVVLPPADQLQPEVASLVRETFPRYKECFSGRVMQALAGQDMSSYNPPPRPNGLAKLHELCKT